MCSASSSETEPHCPRNGPGRAAATGERDGPVLSDDEPEQADTPRTPPTNSTETTAARTLVHRPTIRHSTNANGPGPVTIGHVDTTRTLPSRPSGAPLFETSRSVRTGDVDADRRLRLDGVARYLQDIGSDNLDASGFADVHPLWIVRRTVIDVHVPAVFPDRMHLHRWCSELSNRWCHMRVDVDSDGGADIRTEGFWINISPDTGMPTRMTDEFIEPLLEHTTEHRLRWHRRLTAALPQPDAPGVQLGQFPLRFTDVDLLGHVNNTVYWHAVEEHLSGRPDLTSAPHRATIEYLSPVLGTDSLRVWVAHGERAVDLWFEVDGELRAQARVEPH